MDRALETMPRRLPLSLQELREAWPVLSEQEKIEGFALLSQSEADGFFTRLDTHEQAFVLSLYTKAAHL